MRVFTGFPAGKTRFTPIPDLFFAELLAQIDDLDELKLTLYMFWSLNRQRGYPRYLTLAELEAEGPLLAGLRGGQEDSRVEGRMQCSRTTELRAAVERAVARGTLLRLSIVNEPAESDVAGVGLARIAPAPPQTDYLFVNTPQGRKAVEQVKRGELVLEKSGFVREAHVDQPRPRIFELYEQSIGLLQPLLAEELAEAEQTYPGEWITDAFRIAAENNVRNWRYVKSILTRWARDGKDDSAPRRRYRSSTQNRQA